MLTGVKAPIVVLLGRRFPMIGSHKVLAAYGCLAPRLVTGRFDPKRDRAVWPSTGNYYRGGVAISRILGCRGVAVLPAGMSRERFDWLQEWADPADIIRTPGTESNVKEITSRVPSSGRRGQRHSQSILRIRQLPDSLPLHRCGVRSRVLAPEERQFRLQAGGFRVGDRIVRNDCSRRPPEIPARDEDRSGGSHRMPDHAVQWIR
jgi:hypothetical protein